MAIGMWMPLLLNSMPSENAFSKTYFYSVCIKPKCSAS